jgi:hypothetical protein
MTAMSASAASDVDAIVSIGGSREAAVMVQPGTIARLRVTLAQ